MPSRNPKVSATLVFVLQFVMTKSESTAKRLVFDSENLATDRGPRTRTSRKKRADG